MEVPNRLLIVDDDINIHLTLETMLSKNGFAASFVFDGTEAFEYLTTKSPPDLIILDLKMPGMDGKTFRNLQRQNSKFKDIPVILYSNDLELEEVAEDLACDGFVEKDINVLINEIKRIFSSADTRPDSSSVGNG